MKAYELLDSAEKWTQGCYARRASALGTHLDDSDAVCWCAEGAILKCYERAVDRVSAYVRLEKVIGGDHIPDWNDATGRTWGEVHAALVKADV